MEILFKKTMGPTGNWRSSQHDAMLSKKLQHSTAIWNANIGQKTDNNRHKEAMGNCRQADGKPRDIASSAHWVRAAEFCAEIWWTLAAKTSQYQSADLADDL